MTNLSLFQGDVPQALKVAVLKHLPKKLSVHPNDLGNYRPISNLPFLSKMPEKIVSKVCQHFYKMFFWSGLKVHHSTETVLVKVTNDILMVSDNGFVFECVLLDHSIAPWIVLLLLTLYKGNK